MSAFRPPLAARVAPVMLALVLVLVLVLAGTPAIAQQSTAAPVYNVEVIVFRALGAPGTPENWATQGSTPGSEGTSPAEDDTPVPTDSGSARLIAAVPSGDFKLAEIESRLRASGGYQPIAHAAWQQTASPWGTKIGFPLDKLGINAAGLSGSIALERGQYLHLGFDLDYAPASSPAGLAAGPGTVFVLTESRRVKFFERNYFDHPAFGVIALVTPVQAARPGR